MEVAEAGATATRKKLANEWGRAGPRKARAVRWSGEMGQIGELCMHKSGKVSMMISGDMHFEARSLLSVFSVCS